MHVCIQAVFGHFHVKVSHGLKFFRQQQVSCGKHAAGGFTQKTSQLASRPNGPNPIRRGAGSHPGGLVFYYTVTRLQQARTYYTFISAAQEQPLQAVIE